MLHNNKPERLIPCKYFHHSLSLKYVMFLPQLQMLDSMEQKHFLLFSLMRENVLKFRLPLKSIYNKNFDFFYNKMSFLVEIKFITEDSEQTHKQILILN